MRIARLESKGVVGVPDGTYDFPPGGALILGENGSGKTSLLGLILLLLGQDVRSLAALARDEDEPPEATLYVDVDGVAYRLHRRGNTIKTQRDEDGAWVNVGPTPKQALEAVFAPGSDPADLLRDMPDSKVIDLVLGVVPAQPFEPQALLAEMGVDVELDPMPAGGHVLEWLDRVEAQLASQRLGIGKARESAAAVVERESRALPAQPVPDAAAQLEAARAEAEDLRARLEALRTGALNTFSHAKQLADERVGHEEREAISAREAKIAEAHAAFDRGKAALDAEYAQRLAALERGRDGAIAEAEDECDRASGILATAHASSIGTATRDRDEALAEEPVLERALGAAEQAAKDAQAAHDRHVADRTRREALAQAKADEAAQAARLKHVQELILAVRARAAQFVGDALPGVRVGVDEQGKRFVAVETTEGWVPWSAANKGRREEVATLWSQLRQAGGAAGAPSEGLILLDEAESLDPQALKRVAGRGGQAIFTMPAPGSLRVEPLP